MNWKKWILAFSLLLNVLLLVDLIIGPLIQEAVAQNRTTVSAGGGYVLAAARGSSSRQTLWVVDTREKRLIVYAPSSGARGPLVIVDVRDLSRDFGPEFTGDVVLLPFEVSDPMEAMAVVDTVGKKMIVYASPNFNRLEIVDSRDLAKEFRPAGR